jgi:deoxyribodipyrimidine photo-lyase
MRALMWFRADLRIEDNPALHRACRSAGEGVVAVFAITAKQWAEHDWGAMRVDFVLRNLAELSEALHARNIPLKIITAPRFDDLPKKLVALAQEHDCATVFFNNEYEVNEQARDDAVVAAFERADLSVERSADQCILDVGNIRTQSDGWYTVFTPFKRKWYATLAEQGPPELAPKPRKQADTGIAPDPVPEAVTAFKGHTRADLWAAGEGEAHDRLQHFVKERIERYKTDRDSPATAGTSTLSPYLASGVISARQCLESAVAANNGRVDSGKTGVVTWISELIWREFYRHILMGYPRVCRRQPFRLETKQIEWDEDDAHFEAWCAGRTGFPIVDAGMRQLARTGWMHNRVRMITAMFLTKDLFIDWRRGEAHFMRHLVDGDLASNNGGWQWSASTGTDAAPYFRIFNPYSQSRKCDPTGDYIRKFVPELAGLDDDSIHQPEPLAADANDYPQPIVDRTQTKERVMAAFKAIKS